MGIKRIGVDKEDQGNDFVEQDFGPAPEPEEPTENEQEVQE